MRVMHFALYSKIFYSKVNIENLSSKKKLESYVRLRREKHMNICFATIHSLLFIKYENF
jgi:hypothetical protein